MKACLHLCFFLLLWICASCRSTPVESRLLRAPAAQVGGLSRIERVDWVKSACRRDRCLRSRARTEGALTLTHWVDPRGRTLTGLSAYAAGEHGLAIVTHDTAARPAGQKLALLDYRAGMPRLVTKKVLPSVSPTSLVWDWRPACRTLAGCRPGSAHPEAIIYWADKGWQSR